MIEKLVDLISPKVQKMIHQKEEREAEREEQRLHQLMLRAAERERLRQEQNLRDERQLHFHQWLAKKFNYTKEDILYYFSEFTDQYEWEYGVEGNRSRYQQDNNNNFIREIYFVFRSPSRKIHIQGEEDPFKNLQATIRNNLAQIENLTQLNRELDLFHICLHQFQHLEENILHLRLDIGPDKNKDNSSLIILRFQQVIAANIIDQYELENPQK